MATCRSQIAWPACGRWCFVAVLGLVVLVGGCMPVAKIEPALRVDLEQRSTDLLLRAAQSEDPELACNAIEALTQVAPDEGLPHFRAALRSESPLVRFAGLVALGTLRDSSTLAAARGLLQDPSPFVQLAAAFAAYRAGDTGAGRLLASALTDHPDENVRAEAAHLIGLLGERRAIKRLRHAEQLRQNERSQKVLLQIYAAAARLGDKDSLWQLINYYSQGAPTMRLLALQGLAEVGAPEAREALELRVSPEEDYIIHRLIAARGLAKLGLRDGYELAVSHLTYVGSNPDDPAEQMRVRANAALVLGALGDPAAIPALRRLIETEQDPQVQVAACYALLQILHRHD